MMTPEHEMPLPSEVESERVVLGASLRDPSCYEQAAKLLVPDDFTLDSYHRLFRLIGEMREAGIPIDLATVCRELTNRKEIGAVGGVSAVASLTDGAVCVQSHVEYHARIIRACSRKRGLIHACDALKARTLANEKLAGICADMIQTGLDYGNNASGGPRNLFVSATDFLSGAPQEIDWLVDGVIERGANGFFAAVPKGGKSTSTLGVRGIA